MGKTDTPEKFPRALRFRLERFKTSSYFEFKARIQRRFIKLVSTARSAFSIYGKTSPPTRIVCRPCDEIVLINILPIKENGPTIVGDVNSDVTLMEQLKAKSVQQLGNNFIEYITPDVPRIVLNKLDKLGWKVVGMAGISQTCAWTLYKPDD